MTGRSGYILTLMLLIMLLGGGSVARGQSVTGEIETVGLGGVKGKLGHYKVGCWVPVLVRLKNVSGQNLTCRVQAGPLNDLDGDKVTSISAPVTLVPGDVDKDVWLYYWPKPDDADGEGIHSVVVTDLDGRALGPPITIADSSSNDRPGVTNEDYLRGQNHSNRLVLLVGGLPAGFGAYPGSRGGVASMVFTEVERSSGLPDNVLGYDGFDAVVWQAENLKPSDMTSNGSQMKALLSWVKMGGHLIITVGKSFNDLQNPEYKLSEALPMQITGTQDLSDDLILTSSFLHVTTGTKIVKHDGVEDEIPQFQPVDGLLTQVVGTPKPGASVLGVDRSTGGAVNAPLLVTGVYGSGSVTVVTLDMSSAKLNAAMTPDNWINFWDAVGCWGRGTVSEATAKEKTKSTVGSSESKATLDEDVGKSVDLTRQTALRLLLAVLFLGIYWAVAGPVGHIVLRAYKMVHLSWWVFGATVLVAAGIATVAVSSLRLQGYELKHHTYVMGQVGLDEASVLGYYGLFAPSDGSISVSLPQDGDGYIVPFSPEVSGVNSFAYPRPYFVDDSTPGKVQVPFRSTLKKLQARWYGRTGGLQGALSTQAQKKNESRVDDDHPLKGRLVNSTGNDLTDVLVITWVGQSGGPDSGHLYRVPGTWKSGDTKAMQDEMEAVRTDNDPRNGKVWLYEILAATARNLPTEKSNFGGVPNLGGGSDDRKTALLVGDLDRQTDLLNALLDTRVAEALDDSPRGEVMRQLTRVTDRSAAYRAAKVLILAHATAVRGPLPLTVGTSDLGGIGDVIYSWTATVR